MYEAIIQTRFSAAHHLRDHPGPCRRCHGHNWSVKVSVRCGRLDKQGMVIDFTVLKKELDAVCRDLDHLDLNEMEYFQRKNPTAENLARFIFERLRARIDNGRVRVSAVEVGETAASGARYSRD